MDNNPAVAAAVAAAWPGSETLARFRRRIALELLTIKDGPTGPHSVLAARLTSSLRAKYPRLAHDAAALCWPSNGSLRCKQLLAHGPEFQSEEPGLEDPTGGAFLYCNPYHSDTCVVLDLPALLNWHAGGSPVGPRTPPDSDGSSGGGGGGADAAAAAVARRGRASGVYGSSGAGEVHDGRQQSQYNHHRASYDAAAISGAMAALGDAATAAAELGAAAAAQLEPRLSFEDLGLRAFPGPAAASQLRRLLVQRLGGAGSGAADGLPPFTLPWRHLSPLVSSSLVAAQPSLASPAIFRTFLQHPASAGVFSAIRITRTTNTTNSGNNTGSSNDGTGFNAAAAAAAGTTTYVDCVTMSLPALNRAAAAGLQGAIAAAWPSTAPEQKLKRAAALLLSASGPPDYTVNSGIVGAQLKGREAAAYAMVRGSGLIGGIMARLNEAPFGGFLLYDKKDSMEGRLRLRLNALLMEYPRNEGQDLGVGPQPTPLPPPSLAATTAAAATTQPLQHSATTTMTPTTATTAINANGAIIAAESSKGPPGVGLPITLPRGGPRDHDDDYDIGCYEGFMGCEVGNNNTSSINTGDNGGGVDGSPYCGGSAEQHAQQQPPGLDEPAVRWLRTAAEFDAMLRHCYSSGQTGLAVHNSGGGRAEVAAVYVPAAAAAAAATTGAGPAGADVPYCTQHVSGWRATVYLFDCTALVPIDAVGGDGVAAAAAAALRSLLESPRVVKMAHGCDKVVGIAACCGASSIGPMLDTRVLLKALTAMLPPLPPPPAPLPAAAGGASGAMAALGPLAAAALSHLNGYVSGLREALSATGLWSDRPELLGALAARHFAALREETFGVREWASNPAAHEAALVAAARHLPELWEALTNEAVPWVAMAAAATAEMLIV
ncbi:hypothetical protein VOLCADRAFT_104367 [Volvox carteri f. nagariensis]|uniref:3'-5' exonuclease domain-containing protein n=1 Tax=Volvox carteri f. nagariensis TaxID=3068 RepID=D8TTA4_VOLCA|nr:uncharacterized protein VOLCADRAFT_104367 [Volvox carteri f. nagariensis]EFJ49273.1 hypothetical protein VOLCADRAFT_104367 [Volvox carteri f. nagariensis]|eukprot:XP_002949721.1 hypothetical protein VOLCADRAFT_104367 [Volvox carteri f. nagariensis]